MKQLLPRLLAVLLLVLPGLAATYGFLEIKNAVFHYVAEAGDDVPGASLNVWQLLKGLFLFAVGVGFIGGWIFYRDRKRNYVAPRFMPKREKRPPKR